MDVCLKHMATTGIGPPTPRVNRPTSLFRYKCWQGCVNWPWASYTPRRNFRSTWSQNQKMSSRAYTRSKCQRMSDMQATPYSIPPAASMCSFFILWESALKRLAEIWPDLPGIFIIIFRYGKENFCKLGVLSLSKKQHIRSTIHTTHVWKHSQYGCEMLMQHGFGWSLPIGINHLVKVLKFRVSCYNSDEMLKTIEKDHAKVWSEPSEDCFQAICVYTTS